MKSGEGSEGFELIVNFMLTKEIKAGALRICLRCG